MPKNKKEKKEALYTEQDSSNILSESSTKQKRDKEEATKSASKEKKSSKKTNKQEEQKLPKNDMSIEGFRQSSDALVKKKVAVAAPSYARDVPKYTHKRAIKPKKKRRLKVLCAVLIGVLVLFTSSAFALNSFLNTSFEGENAEEVHEQLSESSDMNKPFNMLLIGTDTREANGSYQLDNGRSDTCILARIDPINYKVTMISIPRDTKITIDGTTQKFNAAYSMGGVAATIEQVKKLCGVEIDHYAEISFNGLTDMVNAVGGVEIYVPEAVNDYNTGVYVPQGQQTLNGEQALSFARTRQFADGDFTRTADQRELIKALMQKAMKMPASELPNLLQTAKKYIKTDLTVMEMYQLAMIFKQSDKLIIYSAMIPSTTATINGVSYVITDTEALGRMIKMVENGEDPSLVEITSGASAGSARDAEELKKRQAEYYAANPNSPGKAPATSSSSSGSGSGGTYNKNGSGSQSSGSSGSSSSSGSKSYSGTGTGTSGY